nr:hypothetical protein CFP56_52452 [Quercus suber]
MPCKAAHHTAWPALNTALRWAGQTPATYSTCFSPGQDAVACGASGLRACGRADGCWPCRQRAELGEVLDTPSEMDGSTAHTTTHSFGRGTSSWLSGRQDDICSPQRTTGLLGAAPGAPPSQSWTVHVRLDKPGRAG